MKIRKAFSFLFILFVLILCFQFLGFEEAFCDDSVLETECHGCVACLLNFCEVLPLVIQAPLPLLIRQSFLQEPVFKIENRAFEFLRPPISL